MKNCSPIFDGLRWDAVRSAKAVAIREQQREMYIVEERRRRAAATDGGVSKFAAISMIRESRCRRSDESCVHLLCCYKQ